MQFAPTWDLFILVFFAIILAYSFIIGKNSTLKIIISSYIAILTADGIGNLVDQLLFSDNAIVNIFQSGSTESLTILKILVFVLTIMLLTIRGSFRVEIGSESSLGMEIVTTAAFGLLSAGLIISTILVYMSGGNFVFDPTVASKAGVDITRGSQLASALTQNYNFWFAMPAIAFVVTSFMNASGGGGGGGGHEEHAEMEHHG